MIDHAKLIEKMQRDRQRADDLFGLRFVVVVYLIAGLALYRLFA